jgi:hypothetical protein
MPVGKRKPTLQIFAENILRQRFDQRMVQRLGMAQLFLCLPSLRNIFHRPLVVQQPAILVPHCAAVFGNPNDDAVFPIHLGLEAAQRIILLHQADEFSPPAIAHIKLAAYVREVLDKFLRARVPIDAGQGRVGHQIAAFGRGLENPLNQVVENAVILLLRFKQSPVRPVPLDGVSNRTLQPPRRELAFDQVFLRARVHDLQGDLLVVRISNHNNRKLRRLLPHHCHIGQARPVRDRQIHEHDVQRITAQDG